jgi:hypothetical protein
MTLYVGNLMGKIMQGVKDTKGEFVGEQEIDDLTCLYKSDVLKIIGKKNWAKFTKWMRGQGAPVMSDGSMGYFSWNVEEFKNRIEGVKKLTLKETAEIIKRGTLPKTNDIIEKAEIGGTVGGRINTRKWNSKRRDITEDQHNPKKNWRYHVHTKRTKVRWNKKKGVLEKTKKGSRDKTWWAD